MKIKVLNEWVGDRFRAKVIDKDTGEEIENVTSVVVKIDPTGCYASIVVVVPEVDLETENVQVQRVAGQ